ncbi:MAG: transglycosylase SLT domain-containing protein [Anaerolineaceae bacterium]|nr:transglycosylase SLT domain-containing protein [Anaerolineaceae bacterium]
MKSWCFTALIFVIFLYGFFSFDVLIGAENTKVINLDEKYAILEKKHDLLYAESYRFDQYLKDVDEYIEKNPKKSDVRMKKNKDRIQFHIDVMKDKDRYNWNKNFLSRDEIIQRRKYIRDEFKKAGIPESYIKVLQYVPFVESSFNPRACTAAKPDGRGETVKGLWQFTETTGREYGLYVTTTPCVKVEGVFLCEESDGDERIDVAKTTPKAAKFWRKIIWDLKEKNKQDPSPELVLTCYHTGPGATQKMIDKYGFNFYNFPITDGHFGPRSYRYAPLIMAISKIGEGEA